MRKRIIDCVKQIELDNEKNLLRMTLGDLIDAQAERVPDNDCVIVPQKELRYTYTQFCDECNTIAKGFLGMGIKKGDHIAIWSTNSIEWLVTMFATAKIGAVMVTVNTNYKRLELEYILKHSDAKVLIMNSGVGSNDYVKHINGLCPEVKNSNSLNLKIKALPFLENIIFIGEKTPIGMLNWKDLYEYSKNIHINEVFNIQDTLNFDDVINIQYTSGTTGDPKGVLVTHESIINNGKASGYKRNLNEFDRECIPLPFFHCFASAVGISACLTHASAIVVIDKFDAIKVMEAVHKERCTSLLGVPTMFICMFNHEDFDKYDFSSLRTGIVGGAPCPLEIAKKIVTLMYMKEIVIGLGMTETAALQTMTDCDMPIEKRITSVGKTLNNVENKLIDHITRREIGVGETGEMYTRGYHVMKGYYKMPELTASVLDKDGWLRTGDLCTMDKDGNYYLAGRLKDLIIRGGENVYPSEVENYLHKHSAVKNAQVVGVPDDMYCEEIAAFIMVVEGKSLTEKELKDFLKKNIASFKVPKYIFFIEDMPITASGKIKKYLLKDIAIEMIKKLKK